MISEVLDSFDWKRASGLTQAPESAMRQHAQQAFNQVMRESRSNGAGHIVTTAYTAPGLPWMLEAAGRVVTGRQEIALTLRLIAVTSHAVARL